MSELPIAIQTTFADLVHRAWTGNYAALIANGGSAVNRKIKGRTYWYWQHPTDANGKRPPAKYIGPDSDEVRYRIAELRDYSDTLRQRRDMVRSLRAARLPVPDPISGDVMSAMAEAGVFRLRAVVIGSVAFQTYPGLLGMHLPATFSRTGDLDIGQFHSIAIAVEDKIDQDFETLLKTVDPRFQAVPYAMDGRRTLRYAIRRGSEEVFSVDVLSPMRGPDRQEVDSLPALKTDAQFRRYLDFLLYQEVNSVALHGAGIPINVPDPARYAIHKLIVAQRRRKDDPISAAKARKDLQQAQALITVLAQQRPDDLKDLWSDLTERGKTWKALAEASLKQLPESVSEALGADGIERTYKR